MSSIGWFMLLFLVAMLVFGLPLSMLSLSREGDDERIMDYTLFFWLYDVLYNQYLLAAGEFVFIDNYTMG